MLEADFLHRIEKVDGRRLAEPFERLVDDPGTTLLPEEAVVVGHLRSLGKDLVEENPPDGGSDAPVRRHRFDLTLFRVGHAHEVLETDLDVLMDPDLSEFEGEHRFHLVLEDAKVVELPGRFVAVLLGEEGDAHHDVLRGTDDGVAVGGTEDVVQRKHQHVGFGLGFE